MSGSSSVEPEATEPSSEEVLAQLDRVLASSVFLQSDRLQQFLRFIVTETLSGRSEGLKEYSIALDVFGRDESFDPQTSSIVRVEASRLRGKLKEYYGSDGRDDPVRIDLPAGTYVPRVLVTPRDAPKRIERHRSAKAPQGRRISLRPIHALVGGALVVAGLVGFFLFETLSSQLRGVTEPGSAQSSLTYSIAVLPLRNLSGDAEQDYLSDGMTHALITDLAKNEHMRVISMTSSLAYKDVDMPIAEIAKELGVDYVIEGSVLKVDDRVRITAQLIEAGSDRHLWAESYARDMADVLAIHEDVAKRIVASLPKNDGWTERAAAEAKPIDPEAYEAYLKGVFFRNKMTTEGFYKGVSYFKTAVEKDPGFAPAHSGVASCLCLLSGHGFELVNPHDGMPSAKEGVLQALAMDDTLAEPHAFLGIIRLKYEWDWSGAEDAFRRAISLNPNYAQARLFYSFFLEAMGRQDEAIPEAEHAKMIDPLALPVIVNLGWQYLQGGRYEDARKQFETARELDETFWGAHWGLGHYHRRQGRYAEAIAAFQRAVDLDGGHTLPLVALGHSYAVSGRSPDALEVIDRLQALAEQTYVSPFGVATIYAGLRQPDEAMNWLERAFADRSRSLAWLNVVNEFDGMRSDPRFESLLRRVGLPERKSL